MGTLYVLEPDVYLSKDGGVLKVTRKRETLLERPLAHVSDVVILGRATVSAGAVQACAEQGTAIHYLSRGGKYLAQIAPVENKNVPVRIKQYEAYLDPQRKHTLARRFVEGKVHNAVVFARRGGADVAELNALVKPIERCQETESLRGLEGNAARLYFSLLKAKFPAAFAPDARSKTPPARPGEQPLVSCLHLFV